MPRERVHDGQLYIQGEYEESTPEHPAGKWRQKWDGTTSQPKGTTLHQEPSLDVTWNRAGWVQVSIDMERDIWINNAKELEAEGDQPFTSYRAIYTDVLTRDQINKMIKVLRRARDQAYGADE